MSKNSTGSTNVKYNTGPSSDRIQQFYDLFNEKQERLCEGCSATYKQSALDLLKNNSLYKTTKRMLCDTCLRIANHSPDATVIVEYLIQNEKKVDTFAVAQLISDEKALARIKLMEEL